MRPIRISRLLVPVLALAAAAPLAAENPRKAISVETRFTLVRTLNAEFVRAKKPFPMGDKGLTIRNGEVSPSDVKLVELVANYGATARTGEKAQITNIEFKDNRIIFEINGGPKKKKKWYQRITISANGGATPIAPQPDQNATGSVVTLVFDKYVPELTVEQVKQMLAPVLLFGAGPSATDQYMASLPPKVQQAIKTHEPLVGMKREMVIQTKGRPNQKIREKEGDVEYEEWLYGMPPADVYFIRFVGDECTQIKIMKQDGTKIVRTEREMPEDALAQNAPAQAPPAQPGERPTLRRPGEEPKDPESVIRGPGPPAIPPSDPNDTRLPGSDAPPNAPQAPPQPQPPR